MLDFGLSVCPKLKEATQLCLISTDPVAKVRGEPGPRISASHCMKRKMWHIADCPVSELVVVVVGGDINVVDNLPGF